MISPKIIEVFKNTTDTITQLNGNNPLTKNGPWVLYINKTNNFVSVHNISTSPYLDPNNFTAESEILHESPDAIWVGKFKTFTDAFAFAEIFRRKMFRYHGNDMLVKKGHTLPGCDFV